MKIRQWVNFFYRPSPPSLSPAPRAQRKPNPGAGEAHIPARLLVKDIIPDEAYIGARSFLNVHAGIPLLTVRIVHSGTLPSWSLWPWTKFTPKICSSLQWWMAALFAQTV
jgi:hypothetical protein